jgi:lethal(2) giant larvae protein
MYHFLIRWFNIVGLCISSVPEDYKINPGAVEAIAEQPGNADRILIGYNRGLMVLWDRKTPGAQQVHKINVCV